MRLIWASKVFSTCIHSRPKFTPGLRWIYCAVLKRHKRHTHLTCVTCVRVCRCVGSRLVCAAHIQDPVYICTFTFRKGVR